MLALNAQHPSVATREGGVDRNCAVVATSSTTVLSPPARVAWIETPESVCRLFIVGVATREGGVDRNRNYQAGQPYLRVATREGGVDRNNG